MLSILHIIKSINHAGSSRSVLSIAKSLLSSGDYQVTIATLCPSNGTEAIIAEAGVDVLLEPDQAQLFAAIAAADIVQVEWWNDPRIYDFLFTPDLPASRIATFIHVAGDQWPNLVIPELVDFVDMTIAGCRYGARIPVLQNLPLNTYQEQVDWVFDATNFSRLAGLQKRPHDSFNIGYVGSVDFKKMHPNFVAMSAAAEIPSARFMVLGHGHVELLQQQVATLGMTERFDFPGFVHDIRPYYEQMDVFGYPLCDGPGAELVIQDAMYAGIPAVVFGVGGLQDAVHDNFNGLVVKTEKEYTQALEYLYHHPKERAIMGENARRYAHRVYGGDNSARRFKAIYKRMMELPKRTRSWRSGKSLPDGRGLSTGSGQFIESLAHQADSFLHTLQAEDPLFSQGIQQLFRLTPKEQMGVMDYYTYYPEDPYLACWAGIVASIQGDKETANRRLERAVTLGLSTAIFEAIKDINVN